MRRFLYALLMLPGLVLASGQEMALDKANIDVTDQASLQRGARLFMNYCSGCHATRIQQSQGPGQQALYPGCAGVQDAWPGALLTRHGITEKIQTRIQFRILSTQDG